MLQEIDWPENRDYRSGTEREPLEFYLTTLENSNHLDLLLGYFSFSAINALSVGFAKFIANGGKMRVIANNILSKKDKDAIMMAEEPDILGLIDLENIAGLKSILDDYGKHFFNCMAYLMKNSTTYSLLALNVHPNSTQHIYLGLLMMDGFRSKFEFSKARLDLAKTLLGKDSHALLRHILNGLHEELNPESNGMNEVLNGATWNESYLHYLSRYSTNLIQFQKPTSINLVLTNENFDKLFEKYIGKLDQKEKLVHPFEGRVHRFIKRNLSHRTSIDVTVDSSNLKGMLFPMKISSLGMNENPFACEVLDFTKRHDVLEHRVANLFHFKKVLEEVGYTSNNFFGIGDEPSKALEVNHRIWKNVRESGLLELVPESESEKVVAFVNKHEVRPWFGT